METCYTMGKYLLAAEAAKKWNITQRRVQKLCLEGRIKGVFKLGEFWVIPASALKPNDARFRTKESKQ